MKNELFDAVRDKLIAETDITDLVGARIYIDGEVPEPSKINFPYISMLSVNDLEPSTFAKRKIYDSLMQIDIWSQPANGNSSEACTLSVYVNDALDQQALTFTTYTHDGTQCVEEHGPNREADVWRYMLSYEIMFEIT